MKRIMAVIASPATGSAQATPAAARAMPAPAPTETSASRREWIPSASRAPLWRLRPTRTLYSETARFATTPAPAARRPKGTLPTGSGTINLRIDSHAAIPAVSTMTRTISSVATSSIRPKPAGKRRVAGRLGEDQLADRLPRRDPGCQQDEEDDQRRRPVLDPPEAGGKAPGCRPAAEPEGAQQDGGRQHVAGVVEGVGEDARRVAADPGGELPRPRRAEGDGAYPHRPHRVSLSVRARTLPRTGAH